MDRADFGGDPHGVVAHDRLVHHPRHAEAHLAEAVVVVGGPGGTPQSVAAHCRDRAVGVEAADFEDDRADADQGADDKAVRAYAGSPGAEALGLLWPVLLALR
jgi:hypothetical protein